MTLKSTLKSIASKAIQALGDVPLSLSHRSLGVSAYDPSTGQVNPTVSTQNGVRAIWSEFKESEIDQELVVLGDVKVFIAQNDLINAPKVDDEFLNGSEVWRVVRVSQDEAGALWILQLRK